MSCYINLGGKGMKANVCDRCKKLYVPKGLRKFKLVRVSETASRYEKSVDLCPECESELGKWWHEGERELEEPIEG